MLKFIGLFLFTFSILNPAFSQTNAEKLEKAVKIYNDTRDYEDLITPKSVSQKDIDKMKADKATADVLLDDVKSNGTAEEVKVARYFSANFQYEIGFVYGMMGKNRDAYAVLTDIKSEYEYFSNSSVFPLNYKYDSQNYSIKYDNFGPTLAEYYTGMAEICANLSKTEESMEWSRKTIAFSYTTDWYKYIALNKLMDTKTTSGEWDKEMLDCGLQQIILFSNLDTSYLRTIKEYNYPNAKFGGEKIANTLEKKPLLAKGEYHRGTAAPILAKLRYYDMALQFYRAALEGGFADNDKEYLFTAADFALGEESRSTATLALDLLYTKNASSLSCEEWEKLADLYGKAGNAEKKKSSSDKADECRKKEKKVQKEYSSGSLGFGFYVGIYPLPLANRFNRYRDYGAVAGIVLGKMAIEGSYKLINRNHVITSDLLFKDIKQEVAYYWEGYRAHFSFKFYPKSYSGSDRFYIGPLVEIVDRTYEPIYSMVSNTSTSTVIATDKAFFPKEKSYNLFFNYGVQSIQKGFYCDFFTGVGASYSKFSAGGEYGDDQYTFSDVLLQNRKPTRIGIMVRMGITIGFGMIHR